MKPILYNLLLGPLLMMYEHQDLFHRLNRCDESNTMTSSLHQGLFLVLKVPSARV